MCLFYGCVTNLALLFSSYVYKANGLPVYLKYTWCNRDLLCISSVLFHAFKKSVRLAFQIIYIFFYFAPISANWKSISILSLLVLVVSNFWIFCFYSLAFTVAFMSNIEGSVRFFFLHWLNKIYKYKLAFIINSEF